MILVIIAVVLVVKNIGFHWNFVLSNQRIVAASKIKKMILFFE